MRFTRRTRVWQRLLAAVLGTVFLAAAVFLPLGSAVPAKAQEEASWAAFKGYQAVVTGDVCNLRAGPGTSARVVGRVTRGDRVQIRESEGSWVKVGYGGGEAWIAGWLIEVDLASRGLAAVVDRTNVNLREGPGLDFPVVGRTDRGETFPAQAKRGDWIRVTRGRGVAWVWAPLVRLATGEGPGPQPAAPSSGVPAVPPAATPVVPPSVPGSPGSDTGPGSPGSGPSGSVPASQAPRLSGLRVYPLQAAARVYRTAIKSGVGIGTLTASAPGRYLSSKDGWIWVELPGGSRGWVWGPEVRLEHPQDPHVLYRVSDSVWTMENFSMARVTATNVNFRAGPGTRFAVIGQVDRGDVLRVLETADGWIRGLHSSGRVGWVAGWLTGGVESGPDRFSVSLHGANGSRRLTVAGPFGSAVVISRDEGKSLLVSTSAFFPNSGALGVGSFEVDCLQLAGSDVRVDFREQPFYQVVENSPGRVVVELRPAVTSVSLRREEGRDVIDLGMLGYTWPEVRRSGSSLEVFLPGATYSGEQPVLKGGIVKAAAVHQAAEGVLLKLETDPHIACYLRKEPNLLELHFAPPGLKGKRIVIDPGHGGDDPGAVGPTGLPEKAVNLDIARRLAEMLRREGVEVWLTREADGPARPPSWWDPSQSEYEGELARRVAWSREADVFLSVHNDSHSNRTAAGTTTYICSEILNASESARLAQLLQAQLVQELGTFDRGVNDSGFYVLRHSACPAVLVEVMYLSNPREEDLLRREATLDKAAYGMLKGLESYFGSGALPVVQAGSTGG